MFLVVVCLFSFLFHFSVLAGLAIALGVQPLSILPLQNTQYSKRDQRRTFGNPRLKGHDPLCDRDRAQPFGLFGTKQSLIRCNREMQIIQLRFAYHKTHYYHFFPHPCECEDPRFVAVFDGSYSLDPSLRWDDS